MIRLQNISKFYYSKGIIASGISKVSMELNIGEFVVITGESGSGKSTLLNVISGLDSYEEGELYIEGKETSHYSEEDKEDYRRKYIGNIFQNYNLVNSYTVYQNVELVLLINGHKREEIRDKVNNIIEKVGLSEYRKTKVSKLSGGQRQRVSIARALAKETSVIVADEPTGNLDSKSAESIVELLKEISQDRLVIVVTHNYDQFEKHATRKIKMHDGSVIEDTVVAPIKKEIKAVANSLDEMTTGNRARIGIRNTFNLIPKFLLLLIVFSFLIFAVSSQYTSVKKAGDEQNIFGSNSIFSNTDSTRIVIKNNDNSEFTDEQYKKIEDMTKVDKLVKNDILIDTQAYIDGENFYSDGYAYEINNFKGKLNAGRMPENENEIIVEGPKNDRTLKLLEKSDFDSEKYQISVLDKTEKIKIVGIAYSDKEDDSSMIFYLNSEILGKLNNSIYVNSSKIEYKADNRISRLNEGILGELVPNSNVEKGKVILPEDANYLWTSGVAKNKDFEITAENIYFKDSLKTKVSDLYTKDNYKDLLGSEAEDYSEGINYVYVNPSDFKSIFEKGNFQSSVFVKDRNDVEEVAASLEKMDIKPLALKNAVVTVDGLNEIASLLTTFFALLLTVAVFFIVYFVTSLIMRSRNTYFATLRMLGLSQRISKKLLDIELLLDATIAYIVFFVFANLGKFDITLPSQITDLVRYIGVKDYIILYVFVIVLVYLISNRFSRTIFKKSAMSAYRGEA